MCKRNSADKNEKRNQHGMCNTNFPDKNEGKTGKCKRKPPHKNKVSMACVRETPVIKMKPARDV